MDPATLNILLLLSQIGTAIGTIVLAIITYVSVRNSRDQLKFLREQTKIMRHDKYPLLKIINLKCKSNLITLNLKNIGEKNAFKIGVESRFLLARDYSSKEGISFGFDPTVLQDINNNNPLIKSNGYVVWNNKRETFFISPKESETLPFLPKFGVLYGDERDMFKIKVFGRSFDLNELINIVRYNKKRFIEIELNLVYQDYMGELKERIPVFRYIFDIEKDKTLEDCFKRKWSGNLTPVGPKESEIRMNGEFSWMYDHITDSKEE